MEPSPATLESLVSERYKVHGTFTHQAYAIGLLEPLNEVLANLPAYPLDTGDAEGMRRFHSALVLYHETTHYAQFVSTAFGLQMARMTNICATRLMQHGPWQLPVLDHLDDADGEDVDRFFAFKYLIESVQSREQRYPVPPGVAADSVTLIGRRSSPSFYLVPEDDPQSLAAIAASGSQLHADYHVLRGIGNGMVSDVALNTAALMEGYAHATEMNHVANALGMDRLMARIDAYPPIYTAAMAAYLMVYELPVPYMILNLAALIDIALMYSPHILYNIGPCHRLDHGGDRYRMPADIFIEACAKARSVEPIGDHAPAEVQRFQDAVCRAMNVPTTAEMVRLCLERLAKIGLRTRNDCDRVFLDATPMHPLKAFALHWLALDYRQKHQEGFCVEMFKTDRLIEILEPARRHITFFDLRTRQPHEFHPGRLYYSSQSALVWATLHARRLDCPLKRGHPYFCPNGGSSHDQLCVFHGNEDEAKRSGMALEQECILDIFERTAGLRGQ